MKRKKDKKVISRFLSVITMLALIFTILPSSAAKAEEIEENNLVLSKSVELADDGTYTINLSAYATGTSTTVTEKSGVPLDIVLVLDQSGSMHNSGYVDPLKTAVTSFVNNILANGKEYNVDHHIAMVGFASNENDGDSDNGGHINGSESNWINTGLFINGSFKNYGETTTTTYSYNPVYTLDTGKKYYINQGNEWRRISYNDWLESWYYGVWPYTTTITPKTSENDATSGAIQVYEKVANTETTYALTAQDYKDALVSVNDQGSVNADLTTAISNIGGNGATRTSYGIEMANKVFENNPISADPDRKRIVVVFTDGQPGKSGYNDAEAGRALSKAYTTKSEYGATVYTVGLYDSPSPETTNFMNYLSSNYPNAQSLSALGKKEESKYYIPTSDPDELDIIFENISKDVTHPSTDVTLDETSVMRDILADEFRLPKDYNVSEEIEISTRTGTADADGNITWGAVTSKPAGITATANVDTGTIDITGFDYSEKYITNGHSGEKLIVTIKGIQATDDAIQNKSIATNKDSSGIYESVDSLPVAKFPIPKTKLTSKAYVLDFGTPVNLKAKDWGQYSVSSLDKTGMNRFTTGTKNIVKSYGKVSEAKSELYDLTYTPTKLIWDGIDSFYVFGKQASNTNLWSKVDVIPATNVYFEDDFVITDDTNNTTAPAIIYNSNNDNAWTTEGTSATDRTQSSDNKDYGYDSSYSGDLTWSGGSAHKVSATDNESSTATFTFKGTGVDIYSKTDMTTGVIAVTVYNGTKVDESEIADFAYIDNLYESSDNDGSNGDGFYQIPTATFDLKDYGTYTVQILVYNGDTTTTKRNTYYLDAIRVYNPIDPSNTKAQSAYDAVTEFSPQTIEIRDLLIAANDFKAGQSVTGAVFIDLLNNNTADIGTYNNYGPKNEVYLLPGNAVAFEVNANYSGKTMIGLKAVNGATEAKVSNADTTTKHTVSTATDMYYTVTPKVVGGHKYIVVENTGSKILSITKLRLTNTAEVETATLSVTPGLMNYVKSFQTLNPEETESSVESKGTVIINNAASVEQVDTNEEDELWKSIERSALAWLQ